MARRTFINFYNTQDEALSINASDVIVYSMSYAIRVRPNDIKVVQTTNTIGGIELEDWEAVIIEAISGDELDVTNNFSILNNITDDNGNNQFVWSLENVDADYKYRRVYLRVRNLIGSTFYSNYFFLTDMDKERYTRIDYRDKPNDYLNSINIGIYKWHDSKQMEIGTYYEQSTKRTVTTTIKSQPYERWRTDYINNDLYIAFTDVLENKEVYIDFVRRRMFEAPEFQDLKEREDFTFNVIKLTADISSTITAADIGVLPNDNTQTFPEIVLNLVNLSNIEASYFYTTANYNFRTVTLQYSQDRITWQGEEVLNGVNNTNFNGTGIWHFRVWHPEAVSNVITLDTDNARPNNIGNAFTDGFSNGFEN